MLREPQRRNWESRKAPPWRFSMLPGIMPPRWAHFPVLGWALGLAIHGIVTFVSLQGEGVRRGMVAREIEHLRQSDNR